MKIGRNRPVWISENQALPDGQRYLGREVNCTGIRLIGETIAALRSFIR
jgi:hypothetical protein